MVCLWLDRHWAPAAVTNIVWATSELYGWLTDQRTYEGQHKQSWLSALADFKFSASQLGPQLRAALSHDLVSAIAVTDSLTADFANFNAGEMAATVLPALATGHPRPRRAARRHLTDATTQTPRPVQPPRSSPAIVSCTRSSGKHTGTSQPGVMLAR